MGAFPEEYLVSSSRVKEYQLTAVTVVTVLPVLPRKVTTLPSLTITRHHTYASSNFNLYNFKKCYDNLTAVFKSHYYSAV